MIFIIIISLELDIKINSHTSSRYFKINGRSIKLIASLTRDICLHLARLWEFKQYLWILNFCRYLLQINEKFCIDGNFYRVLGSLVYCRNNFWWRELNLHLLINFKDIDVIFFKSFLKVIAFDFCDFRFGMSMNFVDST